MRGSRAHTRTRTRETPHAQNINIVNFSQQMHCHGRSRISRLSIVQRRMCKKRNSPLCARRVTVTVGHAEGLKADTWGIQAKHLVCKVILHSIGYEPIYARTTAVPVSEAPYWQTSFTFGCDRDQLQMATGMRTRILGHEQATRTSPALVMCFPACLNPSLSLDYVRLCECMTVTPSSLMI